MKRSRTYALKLSDITNIIANQTCAALDEKMIVTVDEVAGRVTVVTTSGRTVRQRFHIFIVEEPTE